jgi:phosphate uptake regulator
MKRSVIQLAGKTLLVSLPKEWTEKVHVRKGQELEVRAEGARLIVSAAAKPEHREVVIRENEVPWFLHDILGYLYQLGIDEIELHNASRKTTALLQEKVGLLLGFEIVEHTQGSLKIRNVANQLDEEFPVLMRRSFYVCSEMASILAREASHPTQEGKAEMRALDATLNKLTDFCKRSLNRRESATVLYATTAYTLVRDLEKIGDALRDACLEMAHAQPATIKALCNHLHRLVTTLHTLIYEFSASHADVYHRLCDMIEHEGRKVLCFSHDQFVLHHLLIAAQLARDLFGPIYIRQMSEKETLRSDN